MSEETNESTDLEVVESGDVRDEDTFPSEGEQPSTETEHLNIVDVADVAEETAATESEEPVEEAAEEPAGDTGDDAPAEEETPPDPDDDWLDTELLGFARERGMSELQARRFGSKERLEYAILEDLQKSEPSDGTPAVDDPAVKPLEKFKLELDEEVVDPEVIKAFQAVTDHYEKQNGDLQAAVGGLGNLLGDLVLQQEEAWFDEKVNALADQYGDLFGVGNGHNIPRDSAQWKARNELLGELRAHQLTHRGSLSREESFNRSLRALHGDKTIEKERSKIRGEIKKRGSQTIARTARSTGKGPVKGEDAAVSAVRDKLRSLGALD